MSKPLKIEGWGVDVGLPTLFRKNEKGEEKMFNADELKKAFLDDIEAAKSEIQLSEVWKKYLSKTGSVQGLMNGIKHKRD